MPPDEQRLNRGVGRAEQGLTRQLCLLKIVHLGYRSGLVSLHYYNWPGSGRTEVNTLEAGQKTIASCNVCK